MLNGLHSAQLHASPSPVVSQGEAQLALKAYKQGGFNLPENIKLASLSPESVTDDDEVLFCVEPTNRNGDPVVLTVKRQHTHKSDMKCVKRGSLSYAAVVMVRWRKLLIRPKGKWFSSTLPLACRVPWASVRGTDAAFSWKHLKVLTHSFVW